MTNEHTQDGIDTAYATMRGDYIKSLIKLLRENMISHQRRADKMQSQNLILERQIRDLQLTIDKLRNENAKLKSNG